MDILFVIEININNILNIIIIISIIIIMIQIDIFFKIIYP